MKQDFYIKKVKKTFRFNLKAKKLFIDQINNYYKAQEQVKPSINNYKIGDDVLLKQHQFMRGEGTLQKLNNDRLKTISEEGFITPDFEKKRNKKEKTPLTVPVWDIQEDILLKDYIINYSGATLKYTEYKNGVFKNEITKLIPYDKIDAEIHNLRNEDYWSWQCEETKEIRFLPSLARDKIQVGFIFNIKDELGNKIINNNIFNLSFDKQVLKSFIPQWFINNFIYAKRDSFTTNREGAIVFGIPTCYIEGLLVGKEYENDKEKLLVLKKYFPNCFICNLDGKVIL
jgi:hypothetical protein